MNVLDATHQDLLRMGLASNRSLIDIRKMSGRVAEENRIVTNATRVIRFAEFYRNVLVVFKELERHASKQGLRLVLYSVKKKSNEWLSMLFVDFLARMGSGIKIVITDQDFRGEFTKKDFLVYLDDMIYSGDQASEFIEMLALWHPHMTKLAGLAIVASFATNVAVSRVESALIDNLPRMSKMILWGSTEFVRPLSELLHPSLVERKHHRYPIYFDHKIPDDLSSFFSIYKKYIPEDLARPFYKRKNLQGPTAPRIHPEFRAYVNALPRAQSYVIPRVDSKETLVRRIQVTRKTL